VGGVLKILAPRLDSTADPHVTATPLRVSPVPAPLRYLSHEGEGGTALHLDRIARMLGQHECRRVVRWTGTPPALPALIEPGPWIGLPGFEHPSPPEDFDLKPKRFFVPAGIQREFVVGKDQSAALAPDDNDWHLCQAELACSQQSIVATMITESAPARIGVTKPNSLVAAAICATRSCDCVRA